MAISNLAKRKLLKYLNEGKRLDGRELLDYRDVEIELGISKKAEGSARVKMGDTEVLAGVKLGLATPFADSSDEGILMVTAELSPMASEKFEKGPPSITAIELARVIDRGIRESEIIDVKKLCIKEGEKVWALFLDIYPLNDGGNLIDASALAVMAALKTAVFPKLEGEGADAKILFGDFTTKKLPLKESFPLTMTFYKIGNHLLLDPTTEEEEASEAKLTISFSMGKKEEAVHAMQKDGDGTFTIEEIRSIVDTSSKEIKKLFTTFNKFIK